jgi:nitrogen fixation-related uncharacterized protein
MSNSLMVLIPIGVLILAVILIGVLWWWWTGDQEEDQTGGAATDESLATTASNMLKSVAERLKPVFGGLQSRAQALNLPVITIDNTSPAMPSSPGVHQTDSAGLVEVMRIHRDLADGGLIIEMDGWQYRDIRQMADEQVKRRFNAVTQSLMYFGGTSSSQAPTAAPPVSSSPIPYTHPSPTPVSQPSQPLFKFGGDKSAKEEHQGEPTMADQIEEILQHRLMSQPQFASRSIHILSNPDGSVRVEVDNQTYNGIGDVSEPEIKDFLQEVIREWEKRQ